MASPIQLPTDVCTPRYPIPYLLLYGHTSWCLHATWSYTVLVTAWTLVLMSACPLIPYRTGYCIDTRLGVCTPLVLYRAGYCMDIHLGVCTPLGPIPCWLLHGHTSWCLHAPWSYTVLVTAWTLVLISACPLIPYRTGYCIDTRLDVCTPLVGPIPCWLLRGHTSWCRMPHRPIPCWLRHGHTPWRLQSSYPQMSAHPSVT